MATPAALFFRVLKDLHFAPDDHLLHGYESEGDFREALEKLVSLYGGRVGESIDSRHGFHLLCFRDTPDGWPEKEWLPRYLLERAAPPKENNKDSRSDEERELDRIFGFDK